MRRILQTLERMDANVLALDDVREFEAHSQTVNEAAGEFLLVLG